MRIGGWVDLRALAGLRVAVVKRHHRHAEMPVRLDSFIARKAAGLHHLGIHAGVLPPKAAAPDWRVPVRFLVANEQIIRGTDDATPVEGVVYVKRESSDDNVKGAIGMVSEEPAIVAVADQVAVKVPMPGRPVFLHLVFDGGVMKQVGLASAGT